MAQRNGDGEDLRPEPTWDTIEVADDLREEIVGIQLLDCGFQQCARPPELYRADGEVPDRPRTQLRPPPLGIELVLGSNGVFQVLVDVDREWTARVHGDTSSE